MEDKIFPRDTKTLSVWSSQSTTVSQNTNLYSHDYYKPKASSQIIHESSEDNSSSEDDSLSENNSSCDSESIEEISPEAKMPKIDYPQYSQTQADHEKKTFGIYDAYPKKVENSDNFYQYYKAESAQSDPKMKEKDKKLVRQRPACCNIFWKAILCEILRIDA